MKGEEENDSERGEPLKSLAALYIFEKPILRKMPSSKGIQAKIKLGKKGI